MEWISLWGSIGLILAFIIAIILSRGAAVADLAAGGVPLTGRVIGKGKAAAGANLMAKPMVKIAYEGPDGRSYQKTFPVSTEDWERLQIDSDFQLVCLPDKPATCAPASVVMLARQALIAKRK